MKNKLPDGGGDESIYGDQEAGKPYECVFTIPPEDLKNGNNELQIIKSEGSWFLYDAIVLEGPDGMKVSPVQEFAKIESCVLEPGVVRTDNDLVQELNLKIIYAGQGKRKAFLTDSFDRNLLVELVPGTALHWMIIQIPFTKPGTKQFISFPIHILILDTLIFRRPLKTSRWKT